MLSIGEAIAAADDALAAGQRAAPHVIPTGFPLLDTYLGGGLRGGELILLGGPQGLGKTAFALQVARYAASIDLSSVLFSYEHDATTLLERFITVEAGDLFGVDALPLRRVRDALEGSGQGGSPGQGTLEDRLSLAPGGPDAVSALRSYGDRLIVHRSLGTRTGLGELCDVVAAAMERTDLRPVVVVDYLQKVYAPRPADRLAPEDDRIAEVVAGLKEMALEFQVPVLAVVAANIEGVPAGRRLRVNHLQGASALAYEADVVLIMNEKVDVVARHHLIYDTRSIERFRDYVVISIEKNRAGLARIDLQMRKRLEQSRFDRDVEPVTEELVDERVFTE